MLLIVDVRRSWSGNLRMYLKTHDRKGTRSETMLLKFIQSFKLQTVKKIDSYILVFYVNCGIQTIQNSFGLLWDYKETTPKRSINRILFRCFSALYCVYRIQELIIIIYLLLDTSSSVWHLFIETRRLFIWFFTSTGQYCTWLLFKYLQKLQKRCMHVIIKNEKLTPTNAMSTALNITSDKKLYYNTFIFII